MEYYSMYYSGTDQMNFRIDLREKPAKIVSLVPSITELLFDLELSNEVIAVTNFCIFPEEAQSKTKIGGTKNFKVDKIKELNPDLIIGCKEENTKDLILELKEDFPVWIADIKNINDSKDMIKSISQMTGTAENGETLIN